MPDETINGVSIFAERFGSGDPLVLVHGSWVDHLSWAPVVPGLASRFSVTVYDRRGHSRSERPPGQGSVHEDVADLAGIIESAGGPAHVVANSFGSSISLRLLAARPDLVRTLYAHEPPLIGLLLEDAETRPIAEAVMEPMNAVVSALEAGRMEEGARLFVDTIALGPGGWEQLVPDDAKQTMVNNAPTFLDETRDPDALSLDLAPLTGAGRPVRLSDGSESPPFFAPILQKLAGAIPDATRKTFAGAGHVPHLTHPQEYVTAVVDFIEASGGVH